MPTQTPTLTPIENSSHVSGVGHAGGYLYVRFKDGSISKFKDAGDHHVEAMVSAPSPGKYFHANIRGKHEHSKVNEDAE